ncbi:hypothetical protein [Dyadobacter fermentans]|uniref:Lipoprotein n=1 Tax=Dyadobacter fermentans (strain ATCC 700827 / DSM 18053 / CIP 107007 / KCTC 52180 / NS114) TaxID=471854 RepID=C6W2E7_DYAFD|nr:hypothetical protein [Dyadobacter fermentans]ACT92120.1 hypothetical protein Dfer_0865 [Dyadobacter fermentans DSM 18053]
MNISKLFLIIFCFLIFGCKDKKINSVNIDTNIDIVLVNSSGANLIEQNEISDSNIKVYYLINGKKELYFKGNLDYPRGYAIVKDSENRNIFRLYPNDNQETPITLIEFPNSDIDTIQCDFNKSGSSTICTQVSYNDVIKWNKTGDQYEKSRTFTITKNL